MLSVYMDTHYMAPWTQIFYLAAMPTVTVGVIFVMAHYALDGYLQK